MNLKEYILGKRNGKEANRLEREALNDPFLQDAIEGFESVPGDHFSVIHQLEQEIDQRNANKHFRLFRWRNVAVAATIALLLGTGTLFLFRPQPMKQPVTTKNNMPKGVAAPHVSITDSMNKTNVSFKKKTSLNRITFAKKLVDKASLLPVNEQQPNVATLHQTEDFQADKSMQSLANVNYKSDTDSFNAKRIDGLSVAAAGNNAKKPNSTLLQSLKTDGNYIHGKVLDENGEPIAGATIKYKVENKAAITDMYGNFVLPKPQSENDKIITSYIGYEKSETIAFNKTTIHLKPDQLALNEMVVVGYGTKKKKSTTGSIARKSDTDSDIELQGKISGVVTSSHKISFGKEEFIKYFLNNFKKEICTDQKGKITAKFHINDNGAPVDVEIINCNCVELETELRHWLNSSPTWTKTGEDVKLTIKL